MKDKYKELISSNNKRKLRSSVLKLLKKCLGGKIYLSLLTLLSKGKNKIKNKETVKMPKLKKKAQKKYGVNIIGYINAESGVGEISRGLIRAIEMNNIPFSLCNLYQEWMREKDTTYSDFSDELPYNINIIVSNADVMPSAINKIGIEKFTGKYNIGFWAWELMNLPKEWLRSFDLVDEIWTISEFSLKAISKKALCPVLSFPLPIEFNINNTYSRTYFKIPQDLFVFFYSFDGLSFIERKNPFATAKAFSKNFKNNMQAMLIIKCHNIPKKQIRILQKILKGCQYEILTNYMKREEVLGLLNSSDCYVSLHRAEGFGYMLAEAMFLKKHVIATGWSGNLDFMNNKNSNLVDYKLIKIKEDFGPYKKGEFWADPSIDDASQKMLSVFQSRKSLTLPTLGQSTIKKSYSVRSMANKVSKRLEHIHIHDTNSEIE